MKKKIIIILLFQQLVMFSQTSDKYQNKINNNIFQSNQILNQDTLHYYWKNTYTLQMNTKSSLIKESFDELLEGERLFHKHPVINGIKKGCIYL